MSNCSSMYCWKTSHQSTFSGHQRDSHCLLAQGLLHNFRNSHLYLKGGCRKRQGRCPLQVQAIDESGILDVVGNVLGRKFQPEAAVLASAFFALLSVVVNIFGGLLTERKRADLVLELERSKLLQKQQAEIQSVIARYRGPLLESAIDLEQRLWHLATDQSFDVGDENRDEEIDYVMFTLAQFLGFVEVVRREGPRERPFLQSGSSQGTDTLSTLVEGIRFILCSNPRYLVAWAGSKPRTHPGARGRKDINQLLDIRDECSEYDRELQAQDCFKISRGVQRAIGSLMITTPNGADVHYTMSYAAFSDRLRNDAAFGDWFRGIRRDIVQITHGERWQRQKPFPFNPWTRVLLLQQQLVDTIDLLDPDCVRLPMERRVRLRPVTYDPLPRVEQYHAQLRELSRQVQISMGKSNSKSSNQDSAGNDSAQDLLVGLENLVRYSNKGMLERMESFSDGTYLVRGRNKDSTATGGGKVIVNGKQPVNGKASQ